MNFELDDSDDDLDLNELEKLRQKNANVYSETAESLPKDLGITELDDLKLENDRLKAQFSVLNERLQATHGENSILRANLAHTAQAHGSEINEILQSQTNLRQRHKQEIEGLRDQIDRLNTERKFMNDELQEITFKQRKDSKRRQVESTARVDSPVPESPTVTTPKKKKRSVNDDFNDGFGALSPVRRKRKQHAVQNIIDEHDFSSSLDHAISTIAAPLPANEFLLSNASALQFYKLIFTYRLPACDNAAMELLADFTIPDDRNSMLVMIQSKIFSRTKNDSIELEFVRLCTSILQTCVNLKYWGPCPLLLGLLHLCIQHNPTKVLTGHMKELVEMLARLVETTMSEHPSATTDAATPHFREISLPLARSEAVMSTLYALEVLETLVGSTFFDLSAMYRDCWSYITFNFMRQLLNVRNSSNVLLRMLLVIAASVSERCIGALQLVRAADGDKVNQTETYQLLDAITKLLTETPAASKVLLFSGLRNNIQTFRGLITYDDIRSANLDCDFKFGRMNNQDYKYELYIANEKTMLMSRRVIVHFLMNGFMYMGVSLITNETKSVTGVAAVIQCLSEQLEILYQNLNNQNHYIKLINECVRLLHAIWMLHPNPDTILPSLARGASHQHIVALSRIAFTDCIEEHSQQDKYFADMSDEEEREQEHEEKEEEEYYFHDHSKSGIIKFEEDIVDKARDILEQCTTLSEADDIYESMNS